MMFTHREYMEARSAWERHWERVDEEEVKEMDAEETEQEVDCE